MYDITVGGGIITIVAVIQKVKQHNFRSIILMTLKDDNPPFVIVHFNKLQQKNGMIFKEPAFIRGNYTLLSNYIYYILHIYF